MDQATRKAVDDYRDIIANDEHLPNEAAWGVIVTYANGSETYRPFCVAQNLRQMNRFEPEVYATMAEAEAHIRAFLGEAITKERARRDGSGKIIRTAGVR